MTRKQTRIWVPKSNKRRLGSVSRRMVFTWFALASLILLVAPQSFTGKFQFAFARIFHWPLSIGRNISLSARTRQPLKDAVSQREHNQLQNHLANITEELLQKHRKVEELSGLRDRLYALQGAMLVLADVITGSISGEHNFVVNRGESDGLDVGQFVLGDNSVIGTISEVSARTSIVRLITDPASNIAARIVGLNVETVIQGDGKDSVKVQLLSMKHKVRVGDDVYACKKPGFLDAPIKIGTIAEYKRDDENPLLWDITVKPACDIKKLTDVAIIIMNPQR
ncbi:MAG: rod shape-determining protein MreC [Planctomycetota bacterium]